MIGTLKSIMFPFPKRRASTLLRPSFQASVAACILGLSSSGLGASDSALLHEPFDYPAGTTLGAISPPAGFSAYEAQNASLYPIAADDLSFRDLQTQGNSLDTDGGGTSAWMHFDTSAGGPLADLIDAQGQIGADGTTVYLSLLLTHPQGLPDPAFGQTVYKLGIGLDGSDPTQTAIQFGRSWASSDYSINGHTLGPVDSSIHLVVLRIDFAASGDALTVYYDPDLSKQANEWVPAYQSSGDYAFDVFWMKGQGAPSRIDAIALGTAAEAVTPLPDRLTAPSGLDVTTGRAVAADALAPLLLSWEDASSRESGFIIERSTGAGAAFAEVAVVAADQTEYSDNDASLLPETDYRYRVIATGPAQDGLPSEPVSVTTPPLGQGRPVEPSALSVQAVTHSAADLTWTDSSANELGFRLYRSDSATGPFRRVDTAGADTGTVRAFNLAPETRYYFRLSAFNDFGESPATPAVSLTTGPAPLSGDNWVWWEGEAYDRRSTSGGSWLNPNSEELRSLVSGGRGFGYDLSSEEIADGFAHTVEWDIEVPRSATYQLFVRRPWSYSWFGWSFDGGTVSRVDGSAAKLESVDYRNNWPLSWIEAGEVTLEAGQHTFTLHLESDLFPDQSRDGPQLRHYFYDAFLLHEQGFSPQGKLPPSAKLGLADRGKWAFEPGRDEFDPNAVLDLSWLNEDVAGQSGFVARSGDQFVLGNGEPVRFWGAVVDASASFASMRDQARFMAKRGINVVRYHSNLFQNDAPRMSETNMDKVNDIQRMVAAFKASGIYTKISHFFVLGLRIHPDWGIPGYDTAFTQANDRAPFANMYWSDSMTAAYRQWMRDLFTTPNPYHPEGAPLAEDPAVAIVELQNEDNLFFWTLKMDDLPEAQRRSLESKFYAFVTGKYGDMPAAYAAWGGEVIKPRDAPAEGRLETLGASGMVFQDKTGPSERRMRDMVEFYATLQRDWFADMKAWMQQELGVQSLFTASNWKTADDKRLRDLELWTYATSADVIDIHNYFSPDENPSNVGHRVSVGDRWTATPAVEDPTRLPTAYEQVKDQPSIITEFTWVNPTDFSAEGPLMVAATAAMNGIDGVFWFATDRLGFTNQMEKWPVATPTLMGQFPAAALIYRRGDPRLADTLVAEGRDFQTMLRREPSIITQSSGFDPTRDAGDGFDPGTGSGEIDALAFVVGKVELNFESDADAVDAAALDTLIDRSKGVARSQTGELIYDLADGLFTLNTNRSQGMAGYLGAAGQVDFADVQLELNNPFGALVVTSMDNRPLAQTSEILVQAMADSKPHGWQTADAIVDGQPGQEILSLGTPPMNVDRLSGSVLFKGIGPDDDPVVSVLDMNGRLRGRGIYRFVEGGFRVDLPANAMYLHVSLDGDASDAWRRAHFGRSGAFGPAAARADADGDGISNLLERAFGGDPLRASRGPLPTFEVDAEGSEVTVRFSHDTQQDDLRIELRRSSDLRGFETIATSEHGSGFLPQSPRARVEIDGVGALRDTFLHWDMDPAHEASFFDLKITRNTGD